MKLLDRIGERTLVVHYFVLAVLILTSPIWLFGLWLYDAVLTFAERRGRKARKRG